MIIASIGEIWRFVSPKWAAYSGKVSHYLILDKVEHKRYDYLYVVMELETGRILNDLLIDAANIQNYRAEVVG